MSRTSAAAIETVAPPDEAEGLASTLRIEEAFVLPVQLFDDPHGGVFRREHRLMLAVLREAIQTFQRCVARRRERERRLFAEAEEWFFAARDVGPFAFENICAAFRLDPDYIRSGLRRWVSGRLAQGERA